MLGGEPEANQEGNKVHGIKRRESCGIFDAGVRWGGGGARGGFIRARRVDASVTCSTCFTPFCHCCCWRRLRRRSRKFGRLLFSFSHHKRGYSCMTTLLVQAVCYTVFAPTPRPSCPDGNIDTPRVEQMRHSISCRQEMARGNDSCAARTRRRQQLCSPMTLTRSLKRVARQRSWTRHMAPTAPSSTSTTTI